MMIFEINPATGPVRMAITRTGDIELFDNHGTLRMRFSEPQQYDALLDCIQKAKTQHGYYQTYLEQMDALEQSQESTNH